jgi:peptidoglycan/LPS O-acetylase OafA/YrhL
MSTKSNRMDYLDGLRGIAALSVVMGHIRWPSAIAQSPLFHSTSMWVDFFFVLSGFVIAHTYFDRLAGGMSALSFMGKRFARLYPLHLAMLLGWLGYEVLKSVMWGKIAVQANHTPFEMNNAATFLSNLFLTQSLGIFPRGGWNGPSWSISVEFYTYLVFALLMVSLHSRKVHFWLSIGSLMVVSLVVLATCTGGEFLNVEQDYGFFRCVLGFGLGVLVQQLHPAERSPSGGPWRRGLKGLLALAIGALVMLPTAKTPFSLLAPFIFAAFIFVMVRDRGGLIERCLSSRACQFLGGLSYSVYMVHSLFQAIFRNVWRVGQRSESLRDGWSGFLFNEGLTLLYIAVVIGCSWLCYRALELPTQRWINQLFDRLGSKRASPAGPALPEPTGLPASPVSH